jgi:hypothetical protein
MLQLPDSTVRGEAPWGGAFVQSAHPRDIGALALVIGIFVILFVVSVMLGSPAR